jgi:hypothetical protein
MPQTVCDGNTYRSTLTSNRLINSLCAPAIRARTIATRHVFWRYLSFAKTLQRHKSRPVTMLRARPHAIHFKRSLDVGQGQQQSSSPSVQEFRPDE